MVRNELRTTTHQSASPYAPKKSAVEVEYALRSKGNPIGVADYQLQSRLPSELKGKLPSASALKKALKLD